MKWFACFSAAAALAAALLGADLAAACSRVLWNDNGIAVVVGRNMDWPQDMQTDLWAFPRGIARAGLAPGANGLAWTSKYGSVAASVYGIGTGDGINEKGLIANVLWLTEADYGKRDPSRPGLALSLWTQYVLDNFATVTEAVDAMQHHPFQIVPLKIPGNDAPAPVHMALADASGDSAIIEIVDGGQFRIHHGRAYTVMTNSPPFPEQLANLSKYEGFGGSQPLPGTSEAADRFVRAAYYLQNLTKPADVRETIAEILSVMRNVAQPFVKPSPTHPEASHTVWRTVADATDRLYFFESTLSPNIVWVRLDDLDLKAGAPVRKLDLVHSGDLVGDVTSSFKPSGPLAFRLGEN
ncbi:MAG TPA: linear amide C-N hydrolase [Pseudolabrys sp.]|nr:linear amide C-N hydrolase [Pseudolabrys sp.]